MVHPEKAHMVNAGDTAVLTCVASGKPLPIITWREDGVDRKDDSRITITEEVVSVGGTVLKKSYLEICNSTTEDSGEYSCIVDNEIGDDTFNFTLIVAESKL